MLGGSWGSKTCHALFKLLSEKILATFSRANCLMSIEYSSYKCILESRNQFFSGNCWEEPVSTKWLENTSKWINIFKKLQSWKNLVSTLANIQALFTVWIMGDETGTRSNFNSIISNIIKCFLTGNLVTIVSSLWTRFSIKKFVYKRSRWCDTPLPLLVYVSILIKPPPPKCNRNNWMAPK